MPARKPCTAKERQLNQKGKKAMTENGAMKEYRRWLASDRVSGNMKEELLSIGDNDGEIRM